MTTTRFHIIGLAVFALACMAAGCEEDNCNDNPTFVEMQAGVEETSTGVVVSLVWTGGEALPVSYFQDVHLITGAIDLYGNAWQNDFELVREINAVDSQRIDIVFEDAVRSRLDSAIELHLQFRDRSEYIDCSHPGAPDGYYLDLELLLEDAGGALRIAAFDWDELFVPGPR